MASEVARVARRLEAAKESKILGKLMKYNNKFLMMQGDSTYDIEQGLFARRKSKEITPTTEVSA